jgi:hypothetical protein
MFAQESVTEEERASEHEEASSALDEILTHADKESKATVESDEKLKMEQMERPMKQKTTSMFDRIATAMRQEPKPIEVVQEPETSSEPEPVRAPEVVPEPAAEPRPEYEEPQSKADAAPVEQVDTAVSEPVNKEQETASQPKKTRTRKLKPKSG